MGDRCNLVIIENNQATVYYDHWAANTLGIELLWGPKIARDFIQEREPKPDSCLIGWAQGGCVIDFDTQHMLWYGGLDIRYEPELNLIIRELMKPQWKGWAVEWAKDGVLDIAKKANVPIDRAPSEDNQLIRKILSQPYTREEFFYADNVVSFTDQEELSWAVLCGDIRSLANIDLTPEHIANLVRGFSKIDFEKGKLLDPGWGSFEWGAHFNFDTSSFEYWNPNPSEGLQLHVQKQLPNWSVVDHGPNYLWHEALVPIKDWPKVTRKKKLDYIESCRQVISRNNINPLVNVMNTMTNEGAKNIQVNHEAWEHRKGNKELLAVKNSILDSLIQQIKRQG